MSCLSFDILLVTRFDNIFSKRLSADKKVLYFSEAYPTQSSDLTLFGSLSIRRLVFSSGEVDSYAGVDFSSDNSSDYAIIGGEGGTTDGLVDEAEFVYPMSFAIVDPDVRNAASNGGDISLGDKQGVNGIVTSSPRTLTSDDVAFDTLVVADHSSHSVRRVFAYMDTPAPSAGPTMYHPPTHAPSPSPTSLNDEASHTLGGTLMVLSEIMLVAFIGFVMCTSGICCVCHYQRKRQNLAAGEVELSPARSSANTITLASYRFLDYFQGYKNGHRNGKYCEMNSSEADVESVVELDGDSNSRKWSNIAPRNPSNSVSTKSSWSVLFSGSLRADGLLDVSDSYNEEIT